MINNLIHLFISLAFAFVAGYCWCAYQGIYNKKSYPLKRLFKKDEYPQNLKIYEIRLAIQSMIQSPNIYNEKDIITLYELSDVQLLDLEKIWLKQLLEDPLYKRSFIDFSLDYIKQNPNY